MTSSPDLVTIGRVIKAHGIRGEVVVYLLSDVVDRFAPGTQVLLGGRPARIRTSRPHQGRQLVAFDGVTDRTGAERLRGLDIEVEPLDVDDHDTYFVHELVGLDVVSEDGRFLGTVSALIELPATAGYDLLEVRRADQSTWLLPAADGLVEVEEVDGPVTFGAHAPTSSDSAAGPALQLRVVNPPAGLIDDDALVVADGDRPGDPGSEDVGGMRADDEDATGSSA